MTSTQTVTTSEEKGGKSTVEVSIPGIHSTRNDRSNEGEKIFRDHRIMESLSHDERYQDILTIDPKTIRTGDIFSYVKEAGQRIQATVTGIHKDDFPNLYFTVSLSDGREKQTTTDYLRRESQVDDDHDFLFIQDNASRWTALLSDCNSNGKEYKPEGSSDAKGQGNYSSISKSANGRATRNQSVSREAGSETTTLVIYSTYNIICSSFL